MATLSPNTDVKARDPLFEQESKWESPDIPPVLPPFYSDEVQQMFNSLLRRNAKLRPTARELLQLPFIK